MPKVILDKLQMSRIILTLTLLSAILFTGNISAAESGLFTHYKIDQLSGLSSSKVTAIAKDRYGLYWIGTRRGLNYIVNGRVQQFIDEANIDNCEIKFIFTDRESNLWVATDAALLLYNYDTQRFNKIESSNKSYSSANALCSSSQGVVICRRDAIEIFDYATGELKALEIKGSKNLEFNSMRAIDEDNVVLICSQGREIYHLNLLSLELDLYENIKLPIRSTNFRDRILVDSKGRLWISIYNQSLVRYSLEGEGAKQAEFSVSHANLSHDLILDMVEYNGEILVATDGGGLNSIDIENDKSQLSTKIFDYHRLPFSKSVNSLHIDKDDGLFLGTIRDGMIGIHHTNIQSFRPSIESTARNRLDIQNTATMAFCEDANNIWIATDGNGVWRYSSDQKLSQIKSTNGLKVTDICNIDSQTLLIAIYGKGVYQLSKQSGALSKVLIVDNNTDKSIADRDLVISFTKPYNSSVMIIADNIYEYQAGSRVATPVEANIKFSTGNLFATYDTAENHYINNQYLIYQINKKSGRISSIYNSSEGGIIAARGIEGKLWIIRNFSLYRYDIDNQIEELILPEISGKALSLALDKQDNLWVTTFNNILALKVNKSNEVIYFDNSLGYIEDEYLPRAVMVTRSGDILFGGNNGFISIDKQTSLSVNAPTAIELLSTKVDQCVAQTTSREGHKVITAPWNYNTIDIEIYAQNRNIHHVNKFQYIINSEDKLSTIISDNRLELHMLPQGVHTITASYLNNNGEWCATTQILEIVITPPWWNSTPFKLMIAILVLLSTIALIILYTRSRERKMMQLHMEREQELSNNKIKFLINISHELRTPLTLIYAPLKRLLESSNIEGELKSTLVKIFGQSRYMAELINMVLDARRMESGHGEIDITTHNFNEWVTSIVDEFQDESAEHKTELSTKLDPEITTLNFDGPKCRIVLSNLLMNALRYSNRDGSGQITVVSEMVGNNVRLSVQDNGLGLAGVDIDSLFNRFVRIDKHSTGSGIGLSYSKAIIEQHRGGVIGAYCNSDNGATFFFEIPQSLECQSLKVESKPYLATMLDIEEGNVMTNADFPISQHTILVVDDQEEMVTFLQSTFSQIFKKVYTAKNGVQAYDIIKKQLPDIVVSDIMMPQMNGYELCSKIKNDIEVSHTPIVLLTAKADANSKMLGYKSGADAYIAKPFDLQHLLSLIASQLRSRDISRRYYNKLRSSVNAEEITYSNADEQFMIKLDNFIVDNLDKSIDVEMIAEQMCMSRAALYKKLKSILDVGAMEHVTKIRMNTAAQLLRTTSTSITEIAMKCGYNDNQYFSKAFKQFHGKSPSNYRKEESAAK